jgi:hypothetical protein
VDKVKELTEINPKKIIEHQSIVWYNHKLK